MKNYSKKFHILPLLCAVLMLTAAVLVPAGETHAAAYQGWGVQLDKGGNRTMPDPDLGRTKIWGYTSSGGAGNSLVNGTLNLTSGATCYVTAYVDTNLSANVSFTVRCQIYKSNDDQLAVSSGQTLHTGGTGADATAFGTTLAASYARGYHYVSTSYYGAFIGHTAANF